MYVITSIEKGWGQDSEYFTTSPLAKGGSKYVDKITKEMRQVTTQTKAFVYVGYLNSKKVFEIESNSNLTIKYNETT